jgi:hypothetical protein
VAVDDDSPAGDETVVAGDELAAPAQRGLDLDRLLADEDEEDDLLGEYEPTEVAEDTAPAGGLPAVTAEPGEEQDQAPSADVQRGPRGGSARGGRGQAQAHQAALEQAAEEPAGPMVVEDGRTVNFAQNLADYRSPRLAMLLSLLVPGLGQAYSRNYVKAGGFVAAELAVIGVAVYFNAVGKSKKEDAHKFADRHFSVDSLKKYEEQLRWTLAHDPELGGVDVDSLIINSHWPYDAAFYNAADRRSADFYNSIGGVDFTPGWDDNEFTLDQIIKFERDSVYQASNGSWYQRLHPDSNTDFFWIVRAVDAHGNRLVIDQRDRARGYSSRQGRYNSMMDDANSYSDLVNYTLYALLVNHIVSAIDAGFTARAYNARLLGKESVWNRVSVEQQYVFTGSETSPGIALRVRF